MTTTVPQTLSQQQIADYHENGYLIIRNVLSSSEAEDLRRIVQKRVQDGAYAPSLTYPEPGKYTICGNMLAEPGLASIAEHPVVIDAVESLLGQRAYLTAYVAYLRTPGDNGSNPHCDYKRWRPVGSSMNWLFAILPLTDFNPEFGPFLVSPKSHKLTRVIDKNAHILDLIRSGPDQLAPFIDPELKAGDLLLANEHTWHEAPAGTTAGDRCGIFNKYCAVNTPPAAGYYPYNSSALNALSDGGRRLLPVCYDKPITTTHLLIERFFNTEPEYLLLKDPETHAWKLPGGKGWEEENAGWDVGARIGSLQSILHTDMGMDIPWMSYIDDVEGDDSISRLYGFTDENMNPDLGIDDTYDWFTEEQLHRELGEGDAICQAVATWHRNDLVRGKGKAVRQSTQQFE